MPDREGRSWIKFFIKDWMTGTSRLELTLEEQGIWFNLLAMAGNDGFTRFLGMIASGKDKDGQIVGHPLEAVALSLRCSVDTLRTALDKFVVLDKVMIDKNSINGVECYTIKINNWNKYQSDYMRVKDWREEQKSNRKESPPPEKPKDNNRMTPEQFIEFWNTHKGQSQPLAIKLSESRRRTIIKKQEEWTDEELKQAIINCGKLDWCNGKSSINFIADFGFIFDRKDKISRLLEQPTPVEDEPTKWD